MNQNKNPNRLKPLRASKPTQELFQLPPLGMDEEALALDVRRYFGNFLGRDKYCRSSHYPYQSLVLALRDRLMERWKQHPLRLRGGGLPSAPTTCRWNS